MLESDTYSSRPKLAFSPTQDGGRGISVQELPLVRTGMPPAPFETARFTVEPGCDTTVDSHAVHELWMIVAGEGELTYDGQRLRVRSSEVLYFEPPKTHWVRNDGTETMVVISIWWKS